MTERLLLTEIEHIDRVPLPTPKGLTLHPTGQRYAIVRRCRRLASPPSR